MTAEVMTTTVVRYDVVCTECDDLYINRGTNRRHAQQEADRHNKYAHSNPPIPHHITHVLPMVIGYQVECVCGQSGHSDTSDVTDWGPCPRDRTGH